MKIKKYNELRSETYYSAADKIDNLIYKNVEIDSSKKLRLFADKVKAEELKKLQIDTDEWQKKATLSQIIQSPRKNVPNILKILEKTDFIKSDNIIYFLNGPYSIELEYPDIKIKTTTNVSIIIDDNERRYGGVKIKLLPRQLAQMLFRDKNIVKDDNLLSWRKLWNGKELTQRELFDLTEDGITSKKYNL
jgi:hypothetical protein